MRLDIAKHLAETSKKELQGPAFRPLAVSAATAAPATAREAVLLGAASRLGAAVEAWLVALEIRYVPGHSVSDPKIASRRGGHEGNAAQECGTCARRPVCIRAFRNLPANCSENTSSTSFCLNE